MDTRWKNNLNTLKRIFIGSLLRQTIVILIILLMTLSSYGFLFTSQGLKLLSQEKNILDTKLINVANSVSLDIYSMTDYFRKLQDRSITPEMLNKVGNGSVNYLIINNHTGEKFSNDSEFLGDPKNTDFESAINEKSYCYYKANNKTTYSPFVVEDPSHMAYLTYATNYTEYYWFDKNNPIQGDIVKSALRPISLAKKELFNLIFGIVILITFILNKVNWFNKVSWEGVWKEFKKSLVIRLIMKFRDALSITGIYKKLILVIVSTILFPFAIYLILHDSNLAFLYSLIYFVVMPIYIFRKANYLNSILMDVERIAAGNFSLTLKEKGDKDLQRLAKNINSIKEGFKTSLDEQIKNEKLKTELITNVSHDLKTPLTSIVNYVDILQRNDITEEEREDYLKILSSKSLKLKLLIEDLFEISKINSGKIELNKTQVDIIDLLYQALGEYTSYYEEKNINFKVSTTQDNLYMNLDGKQFSRVFENLISNALKYSLNNTRVYIDIETNASEVIISFKNISAYEMDFDVSEIFERFKRGDESRNSEVEGSGLGLAISKSIVELHGGRMFIEKEGDLFKVFIRLKLK